MFLESRQTNDPSGTFVLAQGECNLNLVVRADHVLVGKASLVALMLGDRTLLSSEPIKLTLAAEGGCSSGVEEASGLSSGRLYVHVWAYHLRPSVSLSDWDIEKLRFRVGEAVD